MGKKTKSPGKERRNREKTAKAEEKRARRENKKISEEDDIDAILLSIQKEEAKKKEVHIDENVPAPTPRSNCSSVLIAKPERMNGHVFKLTMNPLKETELILYGGEFYNGNKVVSLRPRIKSASITTRFEQCICYFVVAGLLGVGPENKSMGTTKLKGCPSPRSGHRMWSGCDEICHGAFGGSGVMKERMMEVVERIGNVIIKISLISIFKGEEKKSVGVSRQEHYGSFVLKVEMGCLLLLKQRKPVDFGQKKAGLGEVQDFKIHGSNSFQEVLYKHKIIVFGGFYDTLREVRYFNDLHVFDLDQFKWQEIKPRLGSMWPSARSGFQFFVFQDEIFLYGGYSKEVSSDKNNSEKGIVHSDMWSLDPRTWEWNKVKKSGMPPGPRAGFSMCVHKKRAVLFGGVVDMEVEGDVMMSLFLNELYGFQLDTHRCTTMVLLYVNSVLPICLNGSLEKREENDGDDNLESHEEAADLESSIDEISRHMTTNITVNDGGPSIKSDGRPHESGAQLDLQNSISSEIVKPCGRINCSMVVGKDTLYIYGGMMEVKDQEITLDDLYCLNLSKLDEWKCIIPASKSEWIEASEEEDEDEDEDDSEDEDCNSGSNSDETDDDDDVEAKDGSRSLEMGDAVAIIKGEGKNLRRKEKRARIEQIRANLGLSDSQRTPIPGETLKDFYKRTNLYWQMAAHEHTQHTGKVHFISILECPASFFGCGGAGGGCGCGLDLSLCALDNVEQLCSLQSLPMHCVLSMNALKCVDMVSLELQELRKDGFDLAEARYRELKPILDELAILEAEQKAEEAEGVETSMRKRGNKKNSKRSAPQK
ncbi:Kelch domain-containing protein 4 [Vitis vinifera]|uniref:Kelch domain-containing protein 4 n=1 Tax=Vitis vinifera TaxID=29760 RepID=A0A438FGK2_VITVI|nr:Kelch domain-containing protein 4 [Vitis vinifera]